MRGRRDTWPATTATPVRQARYYGKIDVAVIEAAGINEKGQIIPATCVCDAPEWLDLASSAIIEINLRRPLGVEGLHDIYYPEPGRCIPLAIIPWKESGPLTFLWTQGK